MNLNGHPTELALAILERSHCAVQVGAILSDSHGTFAWGWNSMGPDGYGQHAEAHVLSRANRDRLHGATLYVAAIRRRNGKIVTAKPCHHCQELVTRVKRVVYRDSEGTWRLL